MAREAARLAHFQRAGSEDAPEFYAALQRRYGAVMQEALTREEYLLPRDLPDASLALCQNLTGRLGDLLAVWPRLWNAMTWLRVNGSRLSRPVK
jgi:hypothetical protein